jgi:hypothetical protein
MFRIEFGFDFFPRNNVVGMVEVVLEAAVNQFSLPGREFPRTHDSIPEIAAQFDLFREWKRARFFENHFRTHRVNLPRELTRASEVFAEQAITPRMPFSKAPQAVS